MCIELLNVAIGLVFNFGHPPILNNFATWGKWYQSLCVVVHKSLILNSPGFFATFFACRECNAPWYILDSAMVPLIMAKKHEKQQIDETPDNYLSLHRVGWERVLNFGPDTKLGETREYLSCGKEDDVVLMVDEGFDIGTSTLVRWCPKMKEHGEVLPLAKVCLRRKEHSWSLPLGHSKQVATDISILDLPLVVLRFVD